MHENIINKFIDANILLNDTAYQKIKTYEDSFKLSKSIIEDLAPSHEDLLILTGEIIDQYIKDSEDDLYNIVKPVEDQGFPDPDTFQSNTL